MPNGVNLFGKIYGRLMESLRGVVMISLHQVSEALVAFCLYYHVERALCIGIIWQIAQSDRHAAYTSPVDAFDLSEVWCAEIVRVAKQVNIRASTTDFPHAAPKAGIVAPG